ncbi:MAG: DNA replication/repair protein RecF [Methylococcales bacterium]
MSLAELTINNVRNIISAHITPSPKINLVVGENASGKSTVLEAIYLLGRGTSFRTNTIKSVINEDFDSLLVYGKTTKIAQKTVRIGVRFEKQKREIHIDGKVIGSKSQLVDALPVQLISPQSHSLLEASPKYRRQFLDWGTFHYDKSFLDVWKRYKRALVQRNILIKSGNTSEIKIWDQEFIQYGTIVSEKRSAYIEKLKPVFTRFAEHILDLKNFDLHHYFGWDIGIGLKKSLFNNMVKDCRYGYTQSGPHRGDFHLQIDGKLAKNFISRGQTKLLVIALKLAQTTLLRQKNGVLLIDDLASELDEGHRLRVLELLSEIKTQIFITAIRTEDIGMLQCEYKQIFHIQKGKIQPLERMGSIQ